jgi:hypothetical protein
MSLDTFPSTASNDSINPIMPSVHDAELLVKLTLNDNGYSKYAALPDTSARSVIPLDEYVLLPKNVELFVTCCQAHANSLSTPFLTGYTGTSQDPVPGHRPAVLLHSSHARRFSELSRPSPARRYATLWPTSQRRPLVFPLNDVICPCCSRHADILSLDYRDTFSAYPDEIDEMNLSTAMTVSRTGTPEPSESRAVTMYSAPTATQVYETMHPASLPSLPPGSLPIQAPILTTRPSDQSSSNTPSQVSPLPPPPYNDRSAVASLLQQQPGTVIWSDDETTSEPPPTPLSQPTPTTAPPSVATTSYVSATARAPVPTVTAIPMPETRAYDRRTRLTYPAMTSAIPAYVNDTNRAFYVQNFETVATVLRSLMLLCVHTLDSRQPSLDIVTASRILLATDLHSGQRFRTELGNYSFVPNFLVEHLQDYHSHGIRSSSDQLTSQLQHDEPNCGILRCIFFYREGPHVDATAYLDSFSPLNSYHMILARLNDIRHTTTPRMKVSLVNALSTAKCYRLPSSDFDVDLCSRDPSTLTEIPPSPRRSHPPASSSSRGSGRILTRRATLQRRQ